MDSGKWYKLHSLLQFAFVSLWVCGKCAVLNNIIDASVKSCLLLFA